MYVYIYIYIHFSPPLLRPLYGIFSRAVHIDRPYGALVIFHTGGSVVGVGVEIMVLRCWCNLVLQVAMGETGVFAVNDNDNNNTNNVMMLYLSVE